MGDERKISGWGEAQTQIQAAVEFLCKGKIGLERAKIIDEVIALVRSVGRGPEPVLRVDPARDEQSTPELGVACGASHYKWSHGRNRAATTGGSECPTEADCEVKSVEHAGLGRGGGNSKKLAYDRKFQATASRRQTAWTRLAEHVEVDISRHAISGIGVGLRPEVIRAIRRAWARSSLVLTMRSFSSRCHEPSCSISSVLCGAMKSVPRSMI